ncbi:MAG: hypothetical protein WCF46_13505 [Nitrososphaeraceae archaeon]
MEGINVFIYAADLATLISDVRMNAIDKYSPQFPPLHMVEHDGEIDTLGQLVVSLTKELIETNRNVLELEKRVSQLEKK